MENARIHQIKVDFHVTPEILRYVYVYIIESQSCYLIDSGVYGCEKQLLSYLAGIGRSAADIKGIFLTHAHPDHIGSLSWFQNHTDCRIYASEGEKRWIENIDLQFRERPIPNFYALAGHSARVDEVVRDGDTIALEEGLSLEVLRTAGHSSDGVSYRMGDAMFIGDAVPVKGDIPIMISEAEMRETLQRLERVSGVKTFYPAWDTAYTYDVMKDKLREANDLMSVLKHAVVALDRGQDVSALVGEVCRALRMDFLKSNPLFATTVQCLR
ncbi:MAG: MBL fold metallo-hydrolase [Candidatus Ventricola sp.]